MKRIAKQNVLNIHQSHEQKTKSTKKSHTHPQATNRPYDCVKK